MLSAQRFLSRGSFGLRLTGLLTVAVLLVTSGGAWAQDADSRLTFSTPGTGGGIVQDQVASAPWPKFGQNTGNTGRSPFGGSGASWQAVELGSAQTGPAVGSDGTVYISAGSFFSPILYALDPLTGLVQWDFAPSNFVTLSQQPIVANGLVHIGGETNSTDGILYALDPSTGEVQWNVVVSGQRVEAPPVVASDGTLYLYASGEEIGSLYAINTTTLSVEWFVDIDAGRSAPTIADDGTIYVGTDGGDLMAIDPDTEEATFLTSLGGFLSAPALSGDTIYVTSGSTVYAVSTSGELLWSASTDEFSSTAPVVSGGTVYVGTGAEVDGAVYAFDSLTGSRLWKRALPGLVDGPPAVQGGMVYAGHSGSDSQLLALEPSDGSTVWSFSPGQSIRRSLAVTSSGTVHFGTSGGAFSVIGPVAEVTPLTLDFGSVPVADTSRQFYVTENTGDADLIIEAVTISGPDAASFSLVPGSTPISPGEATSPEAMTLIGPGLAVAQDVDFVPTSVGPKTAVLTVETNVGTETVDLVGVGEAAPPTAIAELATEVGARSATLNGTVQPGGGETTVVFEVGPVEGDLETVLASQSPVSGAGPVSVSTSIEGLTPNTEHVFRVLAANSAGADTSLERRFTTLLAPPTVTTDSATAVTANGATLNGRVNPEGISTTVAFEYGLTTDYGNLATADESPLLGTIEQTVQAAIDGLEPGTTYHYRVVAENDGGRATGDDRTFTTPSPELAVTPPELAFGEVAIASLPTRPDPQAVTIENTGDAPLLIGTLSIEGSDAFTVAGDTGEESLAPGGVRTVEVGFAPSRVGEQTATLRIQSSAGPDSVALRGTGIAVPEVTTGSATDLSASGAVLNGTVNPGATATTVTFEYGPTPEYGNTVTVEGSPLTGLEDQSVLAAIDGLDPGTTYHYRIVAENAAGASAGADQTLTTLSTAPSATTDPATGVTLSRATLNGTVNPGGAETIVIFEYGQTPSYGRVVAADENPLTGAADLAVQARVSGLIPGTTYHYRVVAENPDGRSVGADRTFTTGAGIPTAQTDPATEIVPDGATLNGTVNPSGGETTVTFEYGETTDYGSVVTAPESPLTGTAEEAVQAAIDGLLPGTTYHYRVVAENAAGRTTGGDQTFTTQTGAPRVTTDPATGVSVETAVLAGTVNPGGESTTVVFEYGPTPAYGRTAPAAESPLTGAGDQPVSAAVDGLDPGTTYHFRVVAENASGRTEGADRTFSTRAPSITATPSALRFGQEGLQDTSATQPVTIENTGDAPLELTTVEVRPSDHFLLATDTGEPVLAPGETRTLAVAFAPIADGSQRADLVVEGRIAGQATVSLEGTGVAVRPSSSLPEIATAGEPEEITVAPSEDFDAQRGVLYYRRGGDRTYEAVTLERGARTDFTAAIPASAVTERGVDWYVELTDGSLTLTLPANNPARNPRHLRVQVTGLPAQGAFAPATYRMVSVPLVADDPQPSAVFSDYGAYNPQDWRLLRWDPQAGTYRELEARGSFPALDVSVAPSRAFWLVTREGESFAVQSGQSVDASGPASIRLEPGFNQIASPFAFPVLWSALDVPEGVDAPQLAQPPHPVTTILEPWQGYWVFNRNPEPVQVQVPPVAAEATLARQPAARSTPKATYALQLVGHLRIPGDDVSGLVDTENYAGWGEGATSRFGPEDHPEVPPIGPHVRISLLEDGLRLSRSLRPARKEGHVWDLDVAAQVDEPFFREKVVAVQLVDHGTRPAGYQVRIVDAETRTLVPIRNGRFTVSLTADRPVRRLQLAVGQESFLADRAIPVAPAATRLDPVYPNPSSGDTRIDYQLEAPGPVVLAVYDVLGRRLRTLVDGEQPAGRHTVAWDGRRADGSPVASGTYFVRMRTGTYASTQRVSLVR